MDFQKWSLELHESFLELCNWTLSVVLTHRGRYDMTTILQTTFSNAISWRKMHEFRFRFHWKLSLGFQLTHWGWVTHICVSKLTIIGSDNDLSTGRRQVIIWNNAGILLIRTFSEILSEIRAFWFKKMYLKMLSAKWRPFCLGLNVLTKLQHCFFRIMACLRPGSKTLSEPMMDSLLMHIWPRWVNMHDSNMSKFVLIFVLDHNGGLAGLDFLKWLLG